MLSIIIVAMGESEELKACIASAAEHVRLPHEIILVNNSPIKLSLAGTGLKFVENGHNAGFARAVNRGMEAARGDRVLLLNPDACFTSDIVSEMSSFMDAHERAGIVAPQLVFPDGTLQNSIDIIPNLATEIINKS
ncbi:glycosyltransferase, partial [bacterium]|nr:glycosyltransferase [bacterium]